MVDTSSASASLVEAWVGTEFGLVFFDRCLQQRCDCVVSARGPVSPR